jgi:protein-disulfide isomerase
VAESPTYFRDWEKLVPKGTLIGSSRAPVKVVEFADVECPFCSLYKASLDSVSQKFGDSVAVVFVHYPLPSHRFAMPGARALECASIESRFGALVDVFYKKQDSLGLKSFVSFAREAGVHDTVSFQRCFSRTEPVKAADVGLSAGQKIGVHGTPTFFINGWRFSSAISGKELEAAISEIRAGRKPPGAGPAGTS